MKETKNKRKYMKVDALPFAIDEKQTKQTNKSHKNIRAKRIRVRVRE